MTSQGKSPTRAKKVTYLLSENKNLSRLPPENTDLERRVLAHERILNALIAYVSRTDPAFVEHLTKKFVEPMAMARREHDHRDSDDYAEEFIRAIMLQTEHYLTNSKQAIAGAVVPLKFTDGELSRFQTARPMVNSDRIKISKNKGIWTVKLDNKFKGDYYTEVDANAAAAVLKLSLLKKD